MTKAPHAERLNALAAGELAPSEAADLIHGYLKLYPKDGDTVYRAFRAWTWKALTQRRYDGELRVWLDLMQGVSAWLGDARQREAALGMKAFCDLIYESIFFGEDEPVSRVVARDHVRQILALLHSRQSVERAMIQDHLKLKDANLSRILSMLTSNGLIEREQVGKRAVFRLTRRGVEAHRDAYVGIPMIKQPVAKRPRPEKEDNQKSPSVRPGVIYPNSPSGVAKSSQERAAFLAAVWGIKGSLSMRGAAVKKSSPAKTIKADPRRRRGSAKLQLNGQDRRIYAHGSNE